MPFEKIIIGPCTLYHGDCLELLNAGLLIVVVRRPTPTAPTHPPPGWFFVIPHIRLARFWAESGKTRIKAFSMPFNRIIALRFGMCFAVVRIH
jgi:hypothetical protein